MRRSAILCWMLLMTLLVGVGCRSTPEKSLPEVRGGFLRVASADAGPWKPDARYEEIGGPWRVADGAFAAQAVDRPAAQAVDPFASDSRPVAQPRPAARPAAVVKPRPTLSVLRRRARREARPAGKKTGKTAEQLAREHFLDYPTRVVAQKITLYLPPAYAHEVRLTGASVSPLQAGRRMARGEARLIVRELTLEANRITLRVRQDGRPELQIMARGGVGFVADVRSNILREEGLRSLLITNDQVVPIR